MKKILLSLILLGVVLIFSIQNSYSQPTPYKLISLSECNGDTLKYFKQNFIYGCENYDQTDLLELLSKIEVPFKSIAYNYSSDEFKNPILSIFLYPDDIVTIKRKKKDKEYLIELCIFLRRLSPEYNYLEQFRKAFGDVDRFTPIPYTEEHKKLFVGGVVAQTSMR